MSSTGKTRVTYDIKGVVQGVGFRPALFRLAREANLGGWIQNRTGTVRLVLEGNTTAVDAFVNALPSKLPAAAKISSIAKIHSEPLPASTASKPFFISPSSTGDVLDLIIPPDLAMCPDCAREIADPSDRRYCHPFATCTNCGPRYTVIRNMPYDRERTTMNIFPLCANCGAEYGNAYDRRFHAETIACPQCGPSLWIEKDGRRLSQEEMSGNPLPYVRAAIRNGAIVAIKGIGGFLLACDPSNLEAVARLRTRKHRPHKPFAVMARNMDVVRMFCVVDPSEDELLDSPEAPIVILNISKEGHLPLNLVSPDTMTLGVMLPTSPLHQLIMEQGPDDTVPPFDLLIMTSGNRRSEPVCITNEEARERLAGIADIFLLHDRDIALRNDDSLCIVQRERPQIWRRARGYAPAPVDLAWRLDRTVLAMGAEIKNTVALAFDNKVVISPHVGDLETPEAVEGMKTVAERLPVFLQRQPDTVAVDLHPDFHSSRHGRQLAEAGGMRLVEVQHHHAHAVACLAEHGLDSGLAVVFDGTGLGVDGTIWGAEVLAVNPAGFMRLATFKPAPLPGGDAAVLHPARQVVGRWAAAGIPVTSEWRRRLDISDGEARIWTEQCLKSVNAPLSCSAGRLFDSFSVLLGIAPALVTYDGQSAIRLESAAASCKATSLPHLPFETTETGSMLVVDWTPAIAMLSTTRIESPAAAALAAHKAIAQAVRKMVEHSADLTGDRRVALSGGVFMNRLLCGFVVDELAGIGIETLIHSRTPPNDGCISFGQAVIAGRSRTV